MKLGVVTKLDKRNTSTSKIFDDFIRFSANVQPSGSRIPDAKTIKLAYLLTVTLYSTKPENRTKKSLTQLLYYCFE